MEEQRNTEDDEPITVKEAIFEWLDDLENEAA